MKYYSLLCLLLLLEVSVVMVVDLHFVVVKSDRLGDDESVVVRV